MKLHSILLFLSTILFPVCIYAQDTQTDNIREELMQQIQNVRKDFEQNQKQISDNYNAYHQQVKEEYEKYRKQALEEYAAYVKSIDNVWGKRILLMTLKRIGWNIQRISAPEALSILRKVR